MRRTVEELFHEEIDKRHFSTSEDRLEAVKLSIAMCQHMADRLEKTVFNQTPNE